MCPGLAVYECSVAMNRQKLLKVIHITGTAWFALCLGYLFVLTLRQAGFNWWIIFSLSGHSALLIILLVALYLFAILETTGKGRRIAVEHPLTSTAVYLAFYVSAPIPGAAAGAIAAIGQTRLDEFLSAMALGTLATTFLTWVVVDPLTSLFEILTPTARSHRRQRLAADTAGREQHRQERQRLMTELFARQQQQRLMWQQTLGTQAENLAALLPAADNDFEAAQRHAIDIGAQAWQAGGLDCMRQLHKMAMEAFERKFNNPAAPDYIPTWWDGVGTWRNPAAT